ncbi:phosphosulfolactate phosphohydrolase-like enzyme [Desulfoscipio gibsoniae DSM 7213]|uniref:Probable 2-phosphosulfolactate phosphatase n=1 Tax=Desulfoscipio gibsoniae DSM 7213 TaxID=767817 RepID=R4KH32_9FIRM|nr:phosphosulfolactate phosphohydrolase-like enzyme [Desulfoscipio gibsoniae DSM 7213]
MIPVASISNPDVLIDTIAVVFDVLRATSTIVTALASGYQRVYPVAEADAALALARNHGFTLAGERGGETIAGFPYGNSPLEFINGPETDSRLTENGERSKSSNNTLNISDVLVLTTSNGTGAIRWAASANKVITGSLLNARAAARTVLREKRDISLVCAGTAGCFSLEDTLGAGFVLMEVIKQLNQATGRQPAASVDMDDLAAAAYGLARYYHNDPLSGLRAGQHGQKLLRLSHEEDLRWCAQLNRFDIAPVFTGKYIAINNAT